MARDSQAFVHLEEGGATLCGAVGLLGGVAYVLCKLDPHHGGEVPHLYSIYEAELGNPRGVHLVPVDQAKVEPVDLMSVNTRALTALYREREPIHIPIG